MNNSYSSEPVELNPGLYGLTASDQFDLSEVLATSRDGASLEEAVATLEGLYCGPLSAQFQHLAVGQECVQWLLSEKDTV